MPYEEKNPSKLFEQCYLHYESSKFVRDKYFSAAQEKLILILIKKQHNENMLGS